MNHRNIRSYTKAFKISAIELALRSPTLLHASKELGIPLGTLVTWVKLFKDGSLELEKSNVLIKADAQQHQEQSQDSPEIRKLKNNLSVLLEENQRLKKNVSTLEM